MPSEFNPFSGLGKIESYIRWNRFRNRSWSTVQSKSISKFGRRFGRVIKQKIAETKLVEQTAKNFNQSSLKRDISTLELPLGKQSAQSIRISGRIAYRDESRGRGKRGQERLFTFDLARKGNKRTIAKTLREKIIEAFFSHYDIANKYKPDFRRRFGELDIIDIEGV